MKRVKTLLKLGLLLVLGLWLADVFLSFRDLRNLAKNIPSPFQVVLTTRNGTVLGDGEGRIRLQHRPFIGYGNYPSQRGIDFNIDPQGFRETGLPRPEQVAATVVVLGGSTAFGTGVSKDSETFAAQLQLLLEDTTVTNAASIGYVAAQEYLLAATSLVESSPKLYVALSGWNDAMAVTALAGESSCELNYCLFLEIDDRLRRSADLFRAQPFRRLVAGTTRGVFGKLNDILIPDAESPFALQKLRVSVPSIDEINKAAAIYAANYDKLQRIAQTYGSKVLAVIQPHEKSLYHLFPIGRQIPQMSASQHYDLFRDAAHRELTNRGVGWLDLAERSADFPRDNFIDPVHLTASGNQKAAEIVAEHIRSHRLLLR